MKIRQSTAGILVAFLAGWHACAQANCPPGWCAVGGPFNEGAFVMSQAVFDAGDGPKLYAGGMIFEVEGQPASFLAAWDGQRWTPMIPGAAGVVYMLEVLDDGSGPALYVGGAFQSIGGVQSPVVAKFDGSGWSALPGLGQDPDNPAWTSVRDIEMFDSGLGPELYVGGWFTIDGQPDDVRAIARLTKGGFVPVGTGLSTDPSGFGRLLLAVGALCVFDDGTGDALYAGGSFRYAGGQPARNIARWDGENWSAVGAGLVESLPDYYVPTVCSLVPWSDENGTVLLAAGDFAIGTQHGIASLRGGQWVADFGDFLPNGIARLRSIELGSGPTLMAGGHFASVDGQPAPLLAYRQAGAWQPIGFDLVRNERNVLEMTAFDDGRGLALFVGGGGLGHADTPWRRTPVGRYGVVRGDLNCDGDVGLADLAVLLSAYESSDAGDLNDDGQTTLEDLTILLSKFGNTCGS